MSMDYTHTHKLAPHKCPKCGHELDACTGGDRVPDPGDYMVCIACCAALVYTDTMGLRLLSPDDDIPLECLAEIRRIQMTLTKLKAAMN